jgi:6-phosphogluconolactonase
MSGKGRVEIFSDAAGVAEALANAFVDVGCAAMADRGSFRVALSGGNTPRAAYALLAREPRVEELSWSDVFVYFGDERCVPPDDEQSNYLMAKKAFLDAVPIPPANVHRIRGEIDPAVAAADYAEILRTDLGNPPHFDLVLLGLGPDGHTASLFPGTPPETDDAALVRAVYAQSQAMWRVTITPKVINGASTVIFAVDGADKAAILATVLEGPHDPTTYPSQIVAPASGRLIWLVDTLAAGMLREKHGE